MLMKVEGLTVHYGAIRALDNILLEVMPGEILSVIGANGAGKSTLLKTITGIIKPASGTITFEGKTINGLRPDKIVRLGITMVPEGRRIFPDLSVKENLELGGYTISDTSLKEELFSLILKTFPRIKERLKQHAGTLSGGEQQMLAMGRALMGNPKLLLLDEPSMGLAPFLVNEIFKDHDALMKGAEALATEISENSPLAVQASKDVLNYGVGKSVEDGLKYVASISTNIIPSNDLMEAITAFSMKRKPTFTGE